MLDEEVKLIHSKEIYDKALLFSSRHCFRTRSIYGEPVLKKLIFSGGKSGYLTWGRAFRLCSTLPIPITHLILHVFLKKNFFNFILDYS